MKIKKGQTVEYFTNGNYTKGTVLTTGRKPAILTWLGKMIVQDKALLRACYLLLFFLLPFLANAQVNTALQKTVATGTVRSYSAGAAGTDTLAAVRLTGITNGWTLIYNSTTKKFHAAAVATADSTVFRTVANSRSLAQTQTALDLKQNTLSGTGIVKSTAGTISYLTDPLPIANGGTGSATIPTWNQNTTGYSGGVNLIASDANTIFYIPRVSLNTAGNSVVGVGTYSPTINASTGNVVFAGTGKFTSGSATTPAMVLIGSSNNNGRVQFGTNANYNINGGSDNNGIILTHGLFSTTFSSVDGSLTLPAGLSATSITGTSFVKSGGTSSQFLKADGSVDASAYITSASLSGYLPLTGGALSGAVQITGGSFPTTGAGIEMLYTGGINYLQAYSRPGSVYLPLSIASSNFNVTSAGNVILTAPLRLKGYTVATLPAGTQGDTAFVTDNSLAINAIGSTVVGGGSTVSKVFYNGTNWVIM